MVIWNLIIVNNNHLVFKKEKPVGPTNFISHSVFYWKIHLVLDCDTFRLELDYRSIMHILVKVLYNQDSATRMALMPVRMDLWSLAMRS